MNDVGDLKLETLLKHAHIGVVIHRWDTSIVYANPAALKLLRLNYEQIIGKDEFDPQWSFLDDGGNKLLVEDYPVNQVKFSKNRITNEVIGVIDSSKREISWFMINAYLEGEAEAENCFIVVTFSDVSDTVGLFSFEDIVENTLDVVIVTEADDIESPTGPKIVYVNKAFEILTGYSKKDIIGETPRILQGTLTDKQSTNRIHQALAAQESICETLLNYDKNGRPYWIELNIIPLKNKYGKVTHFAAIERDVSERKFNIEQLEKRNDDLKLLKASLEKRIDEKTLELQKAKAKLEKIAFFDPLTNLPNRRFFIDQVTKLIKACNRRKLIIGFGLLDIDDFKQVNDTYGHDIGDKVLKVLAKTLRSTFRTDDVYCRYGGEEFAFAVALEHESGLTELTTRLLDDVRKLSVEIENDKTIQLTISIGATLDSSFHDVDFEQQLEFADKALYQAKKQGKDQFVLFAQ